VIPSVVTLPAAPMAAGATPASLLMASMELILNSENFLMYIMLDLC